LTAIGVSTIIKPVLQGRTARRVITSTTLLAGLVQFQNTEAWRRFTNRYLPVVMAFLKKLGLNEIDAEDAAQETMAAFVQSYGVEGAGYDRGKGRLRSWLFSVANHKARDIQRRRGRDVVAGDRSAVGALLNALQSEDVAEAVWEEEWQRAVLRECLNQVSCQVRPDTLRAFELNVLEAWPVDRVAEHLGLSRNAVYVAKNRVISRLREVREQIEEAF
jgi:RNA polymerase sigma factor (sigma-70 family)